MKRFAILAVAAVLTAVPVCAHAQVRAADLMGLGMPAALAGKVVEIGRTMELSGDAQRLVSFVGASDTALAMKFGDGGTTATQIGTVSMSTADADDDSTLVLSSTGCQSGDCTGRGAALQMHGNEAASAGFAVLQLGGTTGNFQVQGGNGSVNLLDIEDNGDTATFATSITSSRTTDLGWAVVDGADNTACTSQCTSAAVFGLNLAAGATAPVIVGASDATADICLCAGAS